VRTRKTNSASANEALTENAHLEESSAESSSANGDETGLSEHQPHANPESTNGTPPEPQLQPETPPPAPDETRALLEDRIRRLEDALAQMYEMNKPQARETTATPAALPIAQVAPVATIVPPTAPITTAPADPASSFLFNVGKQMLSTTPLAAVTQPTHPAQESTFAAGMRWTWFFFDAYAELRAIFRMFVDPRYPMSWTSRLVPIALALLLLTSGYWAPGAAIPGIGTLIDKLIDLPLAFLFFKVLSHEARRYRQTSPDLPLGLRLPPDR
jgi:hypothetical protein